MLKKILLSIATLFLIWQSYKLLINLHTLNSTSWWTIVFIAFIINLFITGIFAFSGFAFPTQKLMPKSYYQIHNSKRLKKSYKWLRVDVFRNALLATFWKSKKQREKYFNGKRNGISNLILQSKKSEFGHLLPFVIIIIISIYLIIIGLIKLGISTLLINFIGNFYPILLQRHHRMRIEILEERWQTKMANKTM